MWCTLGGELTHGARQITSSFRSVCGPTLEAFFTSLAPRTQSLYVLHWDAIVLSSSSNNDDDDGGDDCDGDDDGDGDGAGEEKIPQLYIYKLPINRPSGRILSYYHNIILSYDHSIILSDYHIIMLSYYCIIMSS